MYIAYMFNMQFDMRLTRQLETMQVIMQCFQLSFFWRFFDARFVSNSISDLQKNNSGTMLLLVEGWGELINHERNDSHDIRV
jgi:hypothetical protein